MTLREGSIKQIDVSVELLSVIFAFISVPKLHAVLLSLIDVHIELALVKVDLKLAEIVALALDPLQRADIDLLVGLWV